MEDNKKNRGLGKGLSELLGEARAKVALTKQTQTEFIKSDIPAQMPNLSTNNDNLSAELDKLNNFSEKFVDDTSLVSNENIVSEKSILEIQLKDTNKNIPKDVSINSDDDMFETITATSFNDFDLEQQFEEPKQKLEAIKPKLEEIDNKKQEILYQEEKFDFKEEISSNNVMNKNNLVHENLNQNLIHQLPIELVNPNKEQPRKFFEVNSLNDLASSIKIYGIIQPILVNKLGGEYVIIAGERRWRAAQIAGLKAIPSIIMNYNDDEILEVALIENIQRANLSPIEEAKAYHYLIHKQELTQNELAQKVGKSRSYIANMIRLLELEDNVKNYLESGELSIGHARVLVGVKNAADLAEKIVKSHMSVRKVEELVSQLPQKENVRLPKALNTGKNTDILALEADLKAALGVNVSINSQTQQKGSLVIRYESLEQLDEICKRLCSNWGVDVA